MGSNKIIHIDMDCFYAAVEMRDRPELQHRAVAVGGGAQKRGVLATCNYKARQYGLHSAMPSATALRLCPELVILPPRMAYYREVSNQLQEIFHEYTDLVEPISLDEAYLEVGDAQCLQGSATLIAQEIRQKVKVRLGLTASAGVAPLKFLAKIASGINKPDHQFVIPPTLVEPFLLELPLAKLPGVGKVTAHKLAQLKLFTCRDIRNFDLNQLFHLFGKHGQQIWNYSHGVDTRKVQVNRPKKSVGTESTFIKDISRLEEAQFQLKLLYQRLLSRLPDDFQKEKFLISRRLSVKIKQSNFKLLRIERLQPYLDLRFFQSLLEELWHYHKPNSIRLLGIQVKLPSSSVNQLKLWN
ncbi:MAG: DNA polymerase IV [Neisseriaceae bacterium]